MITELINMNKEAIRKILVREKAAFYQEQVVGEKAKQFISELWTGIDSALDDHKSQDAPPSEEEKQEEVQYEENGQLDDEQVQMLRKQFDKYDTLGQGHIKKEDVEEMFKSMGLDVNMDEVMIILDPMVTGNVTFAALASYVGS